MSNTKLKGMKSVHDGIVGSIFKSQLKADRFVRYGSANCVDPSKVLSAVKLMDNHVDMLKRELILVETQILQLDHATTYF